MRNMQNKENKDYLNDNLKIIILFFLFQQLLFRLYYELL